MQVKMYELQITSFDDIIILTAPSVLSKIKMIHDKLIKKDYNDLLWLSLQDLQYHSSVCLLLINSWHTWFSFEIICVNKDFEIE